MNDEPIGKGATTLDWLRSQYPWLAELLDRKDNALRKIAALRDSEADEPLDDAIAIAERALAQSTTPAPAAADARVEDGKVPDRETFWLVERNVSPPQYVSTNSAGWHYDVWEARRFQTEREAHDYWRMMGALERAQFKVVEHLFTNKIGAALPPSPAPLPATIEVRAAEYADKFDCSEWSLNDDNDGLDDNGRNFLARLFTEAMTETRASAAAPLPATEDINELVARIEAKYGPFTLIVHDPNGWRVTQIVGAADNGHVLTTGEVVTFAAPDLLSALRAAFKREAEKYLAAIRALIPAPTEKDG